MRYELPLIRIAVTEKQEISVEEDVEKREPWYAIDGNVHSCCHYGCS
jgi:hypothetical protein